MATPSKRFVLTSQLNGPLNLPKIPRYELVVHEVRKYATHFQWGNHIVDLFGWTYILMDDVAYDVVHL